MGVDRARAVPPAGATAESGGLDPARLESWRRLRRELAWLEIRQDEAALAAERARVKPLHRALRAHTRRKYG